jgi:hypothetical protein
VLISEKVLPVVASVIIIVLVAIVQARSRELAAVLAVMPLTVPLAVWIVFSASGRDYQQTAHFVRSMIAGYLASVAFVVACWYGLRQQWPLPAVMVFAFGLWATLAALPYLIRRIL